MIIPQSVVDVMVMQARKLAPIEACGYLVGMASQVVSAYPMENIDNSSDHFSMDPAAQFQAVKFARAQGQSLLAVYHSHPVTPARPSEEDIRLANDPNMIYVILSLAVDPPEINGFRIQKSGNAVMVSAVEIVIENL